MSSFAVIAAALMTVAAVGSYRVHEYTLFMPNVRPSTADMYLCTSAMMYSNESYSIVGFEPKAFSDTAHHMLLYGCTEPGSDESVWNCGEMHTALRDDEQSSRNPSPCRSRSKILYAWARDAPTLELPDGVGFRVGGDSGIDYLVLQIHYRKQLLDADESGVVLHYTAEQLKKRAGVYLLATGGQIPAHSVENMETSCPLLETDKVVHPFAYRVHTHELGKVVAGYRVRTSDSGVQEWVLLGKRDPKTAQMFYPIEEKNVTVKHGDLMAVRCTMESKRDVVTSVGPTSADEMCNFYVMYWVDEGTETLEQEVCGGQGPPLYYWKNDPFMNNVPEVDASML